MISSAYLPAHPPARPPTCLPAVRPSSTRPRASQSIYNRPIHESAVPKKIHPLRDSLSFHPLLLGFLFEKGEKLLTKGENSQKMC